MTAFKPPMLARDYDPSKIVFPGWFSPKLDGYRCVIHDGKATTRTGKPFRNDYVQLIIGHSNLNGLDGELVVGPPNAPDVFNKSSAVMKKDGLPHFKFYVFDDFTNPELNYETRELLAKNKVAESENWDIVMLKQTLVNNLEELDAAEAEAIAAGYEGGMYRRAQTPYKHGRSTVNEGFLLKIKRFAHEEAIIVGGDELMHNGNEAYTDEAGKTKRSEAKDGLYPSGMLGAYTVTNPKYKKEFNVSCGSMSHEERRAALASLKDDLGLTIRYKFLPHGTKDVPRHGLFAGFRDSSDLLSP